jgi:hypothetical protein
LLQNPDTSRQNLQIPGGDIRLLVYVSELDIIRSFSESTDPVDLVDIYDIAFMASEKAWILFEKLADEIQRFIDFFQPLAHNSNDLPVLFCEKINIIQINFFYEISFLDKYILHSAPPLKVDIKIPGVFMQSMTVVAESVEIFSCTNLL